MKEEQSSTVLYLSYDGLTDPLGQSQILPYLIGLSSTYKITIISVEKPDRFRIGESAIQEILDEHRIKWFPLRYHKSPPVFSTLYDLYKLEKLVFQLHKENPFRVVHCRSYLTSLIGLRLKSKRQTKFVFDMRGFWADERVEGGLWNLNNPIFKNIYSFFKKKEREFIQQADQIISLTENAKNEILSWDLPTSPITVIPTCVDLDFFTSRVSEQKQNELRTDLGIKKETPVLLYLGSWGTWYLTDEMIAYYQRLKEEVPDLVFLIVSQDEIKIPNGLKNVIVRNANRQDVPNYVSLAWASIFFIMPTYSKKASSATKMAEILSLGVPIITNNGWGDIDIFERKFDGLVVREDSRAFDTAKAWLANRRQPQKLDNLHELSLAFGVEQYRSVYRSILP